MAYADVSTARKAGFLIRVVATIIDAIILGIVQYVLGLVIGETTAAGIGFLITVAYYLYFWTSTGQTPGHKVLNLRVIRTNGEGLTFGTAALRYIGEIVSAIPLGLGFLWVIWDGQKQGWHDKIAGTYVIHTN